MKKGIQFTSRFWLTYCLAWIPFILIYTTVFIAQGFTDFWTVLVAVVRNVVTVAIFGVFVVWISNRLDWSFHRRIWFFPFHIISAMIFSFAWANFLFLLFTIDNYNATGRWEFVSFTGNALQWQVFTGILIYTIIASVVYILQIMENLRQEERRAARAETLYAQNSLAVLQAQLNPHFLFNTLHSLMALVRYDSEKAENAIEKLSEMLRYSLRDKRDSENYLVRLKDEIKFVENYLELEKLRLGDRLTFEKNIEANTLDCLLPAFTIQPLIENSIKHGIAPKSISATIFVSARRENGVLKLEISDDGIGSDNLKIEESDGLGMNLIREQLQINYGEKSKFEIDTNLDKGFKTKIEIPVQFAEKQLKEKVLEVEYSHLNS